MRECSWLVALVLVLPLLACAQASPEPAAPRAAAPAGAKTVPSGSTALETPGRGGAGTTGSAVPDARTAVPPDAYVYQVDGRRDPFINVLTSGVTVDPRATTKRGEGAAGLAVNEILVRGVVQINGRFVAMIQGPDGRSYNIHQGDKLADGTVKSVTREGLVIAQEVNDPLSTAKQREVHKLLRSLEEAKQ